MVPDGRSDICSLFTTMATALDAFVHGDKSRLASIYEELRDRGWEPGKVAGWDEDLTRKNYSILAANRLKRENLLLACVASELLHLHKPDTVRGVMYSVVSAGWLPDTGPRSYGRIQRLLNHLRKRGAIPFDWVVDNIRSTIKPSSWSGLDDFAETAGRAYRKNFWAHMPECVEIVVEKDTVAGRIEPVTREFDVALHPLRGYTSTSYAWEIAQSWEQIEKPIHCYYIGDHDPSGRDIERNIVEVVNDYGDISDITWTRLAVEVEQFEEYDILPLEPKKKDRRYQAFVDQYGPRCAEVEAIPATTLREMVRSAIESHVPKDEWERLKIVEAEERQSWHEVMRKFPRGSA